jgi:hypothetical protein
MGMASREGVGTVTIRWSITDDPDDPSELGDAMLVKLTWWMDGTNKGGTETLDLDDAVDYVKEIIWENENPVD